MWIDKNGNSCEPENYEPLKTAIFWSGRLKKHKPPLYAEDVIFMFAEVLTQLMMRGVVSAGTKIKSSMWKGAMNMALAVANRPSNPPSSIEEAQVILSELTPQYLMWTLKVNDGLGTPRFQLISDLLKEFDESYGKKIWDKQPPESIEKLYHAKLNHGFRRSQLIPWESVKEKLIYESGISNFVDEDNKYRAMMCLLGRIWDEDDLYVMTSELKIRPNIGKAIDKFIDPEKRKISSNENTNPISLNDIDYQNIEDPKESVSTSEYLEKIISRLGDLTIYEQAALDRLLKNASRRELAQKYKCTEEKIRYEENKLLEKLKKIAKAID